MSSKAPSPFVRILWITEDPELRFFAQSELKDFQCSFVENGQEVTQRAFDEVPHLIVVDEIFAKSQGRRLALSLKDDMILKNIPMVLLIKNETVVFQQKDKRIDYHYRKDHDLERFKIFLKRVLDENVNELDVNPLTGLPGSRSSLLRIERQVSLGRPFSVCAMDLCNLADYNERCGDARGDEVIVKTGKIIQEVLLKEGGLEDFLGHLGGDDFLVVTTPAFALRAVEAVFEMFDAQGYRKTEGPESKNLSVSSVIVHNEGTPPVSMSEIAQTVRHLKKYTATLSESGYIEYHLKSGSSFQEETAPSLEIFFPGTGRTLPIAGSGSDLIKAGVFLKKLFRQKNIQTVFQPIFDIRANKVVGYEALTRLPKESAVKDPKHLFSLAHDTGKVKQLDRLCIESALRNAQPLGSNQKLFLNLNHETLIDPKIMGGLFLEKGAIDFKNIVIEVTEQSILRSFLKVREALRELKEKGVLVAIDDVGGGAVSLRDVAILKPDYIKFDRSLVRQIDTNITKQQILLSLILFANGIQALTTAEGIETKNELKTVMMCGVTLGQGYYLAMPKPGFNES